MDALEAESFGDVLFLLALRYILAALQALLIGPSVCLLMLILEDRVHGDAGPRTAALAAGGNGAMAGPPPGLRSCDSRPAEPSWAVADQDCGSPGVNHDGGGGASGS